jgi:hypothetical protein
MKRNLAVFFAVVVVILAAVVGYPDAASTAQQKKPTAKEKLATINYLVGSWSCAHGSSYMNLASPSHWYFLDFILSLGYLVFRSAFLPRIIGVLLAIGGLSYLTSNFANFFSPAFAAHLFPYILVFPGLGEGALILWLLVMGVNAQRWKEQASAAVE